jgi:hypothetical protein
MEVPVNGNRWIRQIHRWTSTVFTLTVIANLVALTRGTPPSWITYSPLPPLAVLLLTGLYLFALPYARTTASWAPAKPAGRPR